MRNALLLELGSFSGGSGAVNRSFFSLTFMNLPRLFGKTRSYIFEILFDVVMYLNQHLLKFCRGWRSR